MTLPLPLTTRTTLKLGADSGKPRTSRWGTLLVALGLFGGSPFGCATNTPASSPDSSQPIQSEVSNAWRLPSNARAQSYTLELALDPEQPLFRGIVDIEVRLDKPTRQLTLHGRDLKLGKSWVSSGEQKTDATVTSVQGADPRAAPDQLLVRFESELVGNITLHLEFEGRFREDLRGLYRVSTEGRSYAFSQFEPMDARSAFPCFDEPDQKVPFTISLKVPKGQQAFTNMNETAREDDGQWTRIQFAPSPPMPTYLVAFATGPLEVVEWNSPTPEAQATPTRLITTAGKSERGALALQWTTEHLALLERYFGEAYPYPKLDIVAVPEFAAGAMENAGLVTFREELLLVTKDSSTRAVRRMGSVVAHELAHMWFGDLVTMKWWDDLWLNEGFATWMSTKIVDQWRPDLEVRQGFLSRLGGAMAQDSRPSARTMQQPIKTQTDAFRAFSGITYAKGASILSMVEQWVGPDKFQQGIRSYLSENAWKNATSQDLFNALGGGSHPVPEVIQSFTNQTGVPSVQVEWQCTDDSLQVRLAQRAFTPLGLAAPSNLPQWKVPICVKFPEGQSVRQECTLLSAPETSWTVPVSSCPSWLVPNADQSGYYHSRVSPSRLKDLGRSKRLTAREQIGWMMDASAMLDAGSLLAGDYLDASQAYFRSAQRPSTAWDQFLGNVRWFKNSMLTESDKPSLEAWLQRVLTSELARLGTTVREGDSSGVRLLRSTLVRAAGLTANEPQVLAWAGDLADQWLRDPNSVNAEDAAVAVPVAGTLGDETRFGQFVSLAQTTNIGEHRTLAWRAAAATSNEEQVRALLRLVKEQKVASRDYPYIMPSLLGRKETRHVAYPWLTSNFDNLVDGIPLFSLRRFLRAAVSRCKLEDRKEIEEFFQPRLSRLEGMDGVLRESRERATHCAAVKSANLTHLTAYLRP